MYDRTPDRFNGIYGGFAMVEREKKDFTSNFNEGINQIRRLGEAWMRCAYYSKHGELTKWRWELDCVSRELDYDANAKDFTDRLVEANKNVSLAFKIGNRAMMYKVLDTKERLLRSLQEVSGKGGSYSDDEDDSDSWGG